MEEAHSFAIKCALNEIQKASPGLTGNFAFKDEEIISKDNSLNEEDAIQTAKTVQDIIKKAKPVGELETIKIQSAKGKVSITNVADFYVTSIFSQEADEQNATTLTRTIIPIVAKIVEEIQPASPNIETAITIQHEPTEDETVEKTFPKIENKDEEQIDREKEATSYSEEGATPYSEEEATPYSEEELSVQEIDDEPILPEPPVTQLIVEHLGGLLIPSDTVRIDQEVIDQWNDLYGDKEIKEVELEALNGKTTRCKFKEIKKSKDMGRGIVKMPQKIQLALETTEGELVTVKPVVE